MSVVAQDVELKPTPHVKEWPLLGSVPAMTKDVGRYFLKCYREYGDVFEISVLGKNYKVLAGPQAALFMGTREGKDALRSKEFWEGLIKEFDAHSSLPGSDGDQHKALRDVLRRGYSKDSVKGRYQQLADITDASILRDWKPGTDVPVVYAMQNMVTDQIGIMLTGSAPLEYVKDIRITILYILNILVTRQRPKFLLNMPKYKHAKKRVFQLGTEMIENYEADKASRDHDARTIIDDVMEANRDHPEVMPDSNLVLMAVAPYVAGLDTVANTVGCLVYYALKNPDVLARIHAEVDAYFARGEIDEANLLKDLPVLNGAIMESMRLFPVAVAQMRTAAKDFVFQGHQIREGEMIYLATAAPHLMEEYYPDPEKFDPDRYRPPRNEHKAQGAYSPYGRGPHTCLGKSLAEVQMCLGMARLFHKVDMELESPDYVLKTKMAPTPGPSYNFKVRVKGYRN